MSDTILVTAAGNARSTTQNHTSATKKLNSFLRKNSTTNPVTSVSPMPTTSRLRTPATIAPLEAYTFSRKCTLSEFILDYYKYGLQSPLQWNVLTERQDKSACNLPMYGDCYV